MKKSFTIGMGYDEVVACISGNTVSFEETFNRLKEVIKPFAKSFEIARIESRLSAPGSSFVPEGVEAYYEIYVDDTLPIGEPIFYEYETYEKGKASFTIYPRAMKNYSEDEEHQLFFMVQLLLILGCKQRMSAMLDKTLKTDIMTGLPNIKVFENRCEQLIKERQITRFDAIYFNIKNFKYVNKLVAYSNGDYVMAQYAQKISCFINEEEIIARLGGDNFVALILKERRGAFIDFLHGIDIEITGLGGAMQQITLGAISGIFEIKDEDVHFSDIMLGVSMALQAAKRIYHKDYYYFTVELAQKILEEQRISMDFEKSLIEGEFKAYFQPKFSLENGKLCGAEALARWNNKGKIVSPAAFIPRLEKDGTICRLDFEILRQVCIQIAKWLKAGKEPVRVSVNFSRWHLQNNHFVEDIKGVLDEYGVPTKYIEVELTETMNDEEYERMSRVVTQFREKGITTSIDDFGTGFSSLNLLKKLDVDVLKLDKSFLDEIGNPKEGKKDRILIQNIINLARDFDMQVIAEGVETTVQRDFLIEARCHMAQGYLYAKPLPLEEFETLLR